MKQVSLADTLDEYQTYVEGSFQIDGNDKTVSVTASDENIQTLTYDFGAGDGIKANTDYVITYKTKTADSVYYDGEDEKTFKTDETVISNTARLLDGEANNIGEKTAEVPVKPEWVIKDYKLEGNTITWTLEIMPNQRSVSSVTVHDRYTKFLELRGEPRIISGSATLSDAAVAPSSVDGYMEMSFDLTGITDAVKIEYVTEVDADYFKTGGIELGNTVWLTVDFGDGHGEYELPEFKKNAEVPSNLITKKRVKTNYASHQISWRITVNGNETESNRTDFDKIVVRENLSKGRGGSPTKFVSAQCIRPDGTPDDSMTIKYYTSDNTETTDKDAAAYVIFEIIGSGTETRYIDVVTELTNPDVYGVNKRTTIYNYATITTDSVYGTNRNLPSDVEVNATASYTSKMLEKTLVSYNYETKTASWKIIVNHNETALTGVELTDDMPTGLTLDTSSVMLGETSLADDGRNLSTEKQLRIADTDFSSDCESTVYFDTFVDTDVINEGQLKTKPQTTVTNSAKLTYTDPDTGKEEIVTSSEDCVIENPMGKTSSYDKDSGTITYTVKLNSAGIKYSDGNTITLTDALDSQCGVCLDVATICVYRGVVREDGDITKGAEKLNYSVLYNRKAESDLGLDANSFRLTVPDSTPLYIEYTVDIVDTTKSAYQNNITLDNTDVTASRRQSGISTEGGATGTLSRKGSITLTKVNSKDEGTKIKGAEFELYLLDESTNPATETFFDKGTTDENGQIKFTLLNADRKYKLVETKAAEGYLSDADSLYSGIVYVGTGDARNVVLEAITNAPLLRVYYNGNGGTTNVTDSVGYEKNENVSVKAPDADGASTTKAGYDFVEWNTEPGGGGTAYNGGDTYPNIQEDTTFYAQWEPAINGSVYRVKHYLQNLDGEGYTEFETEELPGTAEETATAEPKEYEGFTFNEDVEGTVISDIIKGDSTTVLKLYYDRDKYNVTYDGNGGTTSVADENSPYYHGTTVTVKDQGDTAKEGYTFVNWNTDPEGNGITYNGEGTATFVIEKDTTLYAQYRPNTDTLYRVEYYLENLEKTGFDIDESAGYTDAGTTDTEATAELKTFPGFTLDETVSGSMLSGIIAGDGSLVLKVYYTRNTDTKYKVEYYLQNVDGTDYEINNEATENLEGITGATATAEEKTFEHFELNKGAEGTLETSEIAPDGSTVLKLYYDRNRYNVIYDGNGGTTTVADENSPYYYGSTVTVKDKGDTAKVGYTFTEWNTEPDGSGTTYGGEGTSTFVIEGDTTIYAQYTPNTDTAYRVEYYLENLEKTGFDIDESAGYTDAGTTDTEATAEIKTFPGFTLDETVSGSMLSGIIAGDGSLVLKVYYTRNTDTKYKVEYYLQNVDGTDYEINDEATENLEGITGATVTAEEKTFEHFELNKDVEGTLASAEIAPDGTTVLKLYYDRNKYNVIYDGNGGTTTVADENSPYYYGSTVTVKDKGDTAKVGYTFTEWNTEPDGSGTTYGGEGTSTFVIEKDTTLYAQYSPNTDTRYRVEYYLQNVDGTDYEINNEATENLEGMAGATVTAEEKTFEHFELNKDVEGTLASAEIAPDGTTVLKLYYDRNKYNVIYDGNGGTTTVTDENSPYYYGSTVTVKDKGNTERSGYNFLYWNTEPDGSGITYTVSDVNTFTITEDTTLYAQWRNRSGGGGGGGTSFSTTTATPAPSAETESPETPVTEKNEFDIRITKQLADGQKRVVMPGETVKYTVTVTNNGTNTIHNVVVYDEMGTEGGVIDTIESLAPGESKTYELEITVSAAAKQNDVIEGSATANSNETGEVQGEAGVVVTVGQTTVPELLTTDHVWYLRGYPDNSIRPEGNITRAEVTMAFYRLLNDRKDIEDFDKSDYSDVDMNEWYAVSVMTLSELGIVTGYSDGTFLPDEPMTRGEVAAVASRFDKLESTDENMFADIDGHWGEEYIKSAYKKGWVDGYPDNTFRPDDSIKRCEFATLVNNVLNRRPNKENILISDIHIFSDLDENEWYFTPMVEASHTHDCETIQGTAAEQWSRVIGDGTSAEFNQ